MTLWKEKATTRVQAYLRTRLLWDTCSSDAANGWGDTETAPVAQAWATSGGSASDYSKAGGVGRISLGTVSTNRIVTAGTGFGDVEWEATVTIPVVAATDSINFYLLARVVDVNNYYSFRATFDIDSTVDLIMGRVIGGSGVALATAADALSYAAGTTVRMRLQAYCTGTGTSLKGRIWLATDDEPDEWNIDNVVDNTPELLTGGVGFRAALGVANTNTLPVVVTVDDATAFSPPQWTLISTGNPTVLPAETGRVLVGRRGTPIVGTIGRATELSTIDPSQMGLVLEDRDGRLTPGNQLSPLWPDWKSGVPIRWTETVGARTFPFPDMYLELPQNFLTFESSNNADLTDRVLEVRCVDLLTRLNNAPEFTSSLGAFIVGEAAPGALRAYWPLTDAAGSSYANSAGPINQEPLRFTQIDSYSPVKFDGTLMNFGSQDGPPGDDSTSLEFTQLVPIGGTNPRGRLANDAVLDTAPGTSVVTFLTWVYAPATVTFGQLALARDLDTFSIFIRLDTDNAGNWQFGFDTFNGASADVPGPAIIPERWHLLGGQLDFADGDYAMWVDDGFVTTGTLVGGGGSAGFSMNRVVIDGGEADVLDVRMAHVQLYIGDADAFTREDFLIQYDRGINGFPYQTVDERIRMIANYAGIGDGQLDLQESDSLIQQPEFAGQTPGALASAAAITGGGILFTRGSELVYQDRKFRFNL